MATASSSMAMPSICLPPPHLSDNHPPWRATCYEHSRATSSISLSHAHGTTSLAASTSSTRSLSDEWDLEWHVGTTSPNTALDFLTIPEPQPTCSARTFYLKLNTDNPSTPIIVTPSTPTSALHADAITRTATTTTLNTTAIINKYLRPTSYEWRNDPIFTFRVWFQIQIRRLLRIYDHIHPGLSLVANSAPARVILTVLWAAGNVFGFLLVLIALCLLPYVLDSHARPNGTPVTWSVWADLVGEEMHEAVDRWTERVCALTREAYANATFRLQRARLRDGGAVRGGTRDHTEEVVDGTIIGETETVAQETMHEFGASNGHGNDGAQDDEDSEGTTKKKKKRSQTRGGKAKRRRALGG